MIKGHDHSTNTIILRLQQLIKRKAKQWALHTTYRDDQILPSLQYSLLLLTFRNLVFFLRNVLLSHMPPPEQEIDMWLRASHQHQKLHHPILLLLRQLIELVLGDLVLPEKEVEVWL
jgi:hypothetical protein